jgi:DNA-binding transcriptional MerR regulator
MSQPFTRTQFVEQFRPDPQRLYDVDTSARLAGVPRRAVLVYCRWGFVHPVTNPEVEARYFDSDAISAIQWAEYLRVSRGVNLPGVRVIFQMVEEVGRKRPVNW